MKDYEKPTIDVCQMRHEGVYAASGDTAADGSGGSGKPGCDSKYVNGVWQQPKYDGNTYLSNLGCNGCPAFRADSCGLQTDQAYLDGATSYNVDNGKRMPGWEAKGHKPDEKIDWSTYDM